MILYLRLITILVSLTTTSCLQQEFVDVIHSDNSCDLLSQQTELKPGGLIPYVEEFVNYTHAFKKKCFVVSKIEILEDETFFEVTREDKNQVPSVVGFCDFVFGEVYIKRSYWDESTEQSKRGLIFHELGHCALGFGHRKGLAIMNPTMLDSYIYKLVWVPLAIDFFNNQEFSVVDWLYGE